MYLIRYKLNVRHNLLLGFVVNERINNLPHFHKYVWCIDNKQLPQSFRVVILHPKMYSHYNIRTSIPASRKQTHVNIDLIPNSCVTYYQTH